MGDALPVVADQFDEDEVQEIVDAICDATGEEFEGRRFTWDLEHRWALEGAIKSVFGVEDGDEEGEE